MGCVCVLLLFLFVCLFCVCFAFVLFCVLFFNLILFGFCFLFWFLFVCFLIFFFVCVLTYRFKRTFPRQFLIILIFTKRARRTLSESGMYLKIITYIRIIHFVQKKYDTGGRTIKLVLKKNSLSCLCFDWELIETARDSRRYCKRRYNKIILQQ